MKFNLKEQIKNKSFWLSVTALLVLTAQQFGLDFLPNNFQDSDNSALTILVGMGIITDFKTDGFGE